ncbi:MAG: hypothetical protein ACW981_08565 [Candidatus Hodarchaeales archaeon]|jgi:hypothetical protein
MSTESESKSEDFVFFKRMLKEHIVYALLLAVALIVTFILALFLVIWWIENSEIGGFGQWTFNQWSLSNVILFAIYLVLLEILLFVVVGFVLFAFFKFFWWNNLSDDNKSKFQSNRRQRKRKWGRNGRWGKGREFSGFGGFTFLSFLIIVFFEGNIETTFGTFGYDYWMIAWLKAFVIMAIVWGFIYTGYALWFIRQPEESV